MRSCSQPLPLLLLLLVVAAAAASPLHQQQAIILHGSALVVPADSGSAPPAVSAAAATATLCAASGLVPPLVVGQADAARVQELVQAGSASSVGAGPKALLLLHLAGVSPDSRAFADKVQAAWSKEGSTLHLDLEQQQQQPSSVTTAGSLLQAASDIVAANPDAKVTVLDHSALQDCKGGHCLQQHLHQAMHHCGGKVVQPAPAHRQQQQRPAALLTGRLELPGLQEGGLDVQLPGVRLFALELAALQGSVQQLLARLETQSAEELDKVTSVYESTFVGLQALAAHFPRGTPEFEAAEAALMTLLGGVVTSLQGVYGSSDMLHQVAFLGDAPVSSGDASHLMEWKEVARRVLLQRSVLEGEPADPLAQQPSTSSASYQQGEGPSSKRYAEKATAYAVTLLLIWFTFAGVYCMVAMPFKQDTLLYGRTKAD